MNDLFNNKVGPQLRITQKKRSFKPLIILIVIVLSSQIATEIAAYKLQFSTLLGLSIAHLYAPWSIFVWWSKWGNYYPEVFKLAASCGVLVSATGLLGCLLMLFRTQVKGNPYLHGSARWANEEDIKAAGLMDGEGVYVGAWVDEKGCIRYLRHNGPEHILTYAPTRSGKGVGLVIPTLLSWPDSAVITDLKGELWALTAGWRKQHANNCVLRFEPATKIGSAAWNALDEIRIATEYEVGDVQNLATLVVDPDGKGLESHWQKTSQPLLVGLILHVLYKQLNEGIIANLPLVDHLIANPEQSIADLFVEMKAYLHLGDKPHPVVSASAQDMIDRPEEEAGSIVSTLKSYLSLYRDPIVAHNVSRSDFKIKDLMNHSKPVSLYIVTQPNDKERLKPLVRVLVNMIVRLLADKMEFERVDAGDSKPAKFWKKTQPTYSALKTKKSYNYRLLGMIDEFPSLGKLDILQESLAFVAGYGIKFYLICQDINQLICEKKGYGTNESITSNCHIQNAYPPNLLKTAEHLSKSTGVTTIIKEQVTVSGGRFAAFLGQVSKNIQETQRPLLTPDECQRLPSPKKNKAGQIIEAGDMVIYVNGKPAIYGKQPLYFQEPVFLARSSIEAPIHSDTLYQALSPEEAISL